MVTGLGASSLTSVSINAEDKNFEDNILSRRDFKEKYIDRHATILKMIDNLKGNLQ